MPSTTSRPALVLGFIYFYLLIWLLQVFLEAPRLSLVAASRGSSSLQGRGFSLRWLLLLRSRALGVRAFWVAACGLSSCGVRVSGHTGSVIAAHGLSCSMACEIFLDPGFGWMPIQCHQRSPPPFTSNLKWEVIKQASPGVNWWWGTEVKVWTVMIDEPRRMKELWSKETENKKWWLSFGKSTPVRVQESNHFFHAYRASRD